jgi:diguanylate cyclase (GGDEF)-like protein
MPMLLLLLLLLMAVAVIAYFYKSKPSKNDIALKQLNASKSSDVPQSLQNTDILSFLNEIDCAVLSNAGFDYVLEMFFSNLKAFVPCELVSVTQLDIGAVDISGMLVITQAGERHEYPTLLDNSLKKILSVNPNGYFLENFDMYPSLKPFTELGVAKVLLMPVYRDAELATVLYFGFSKNTELTAEILLIARYFADRLGVALTCVVRAKSLYYQENFDCVTMLPNRRFCRNYLAKEIMRAQRFETEVGVLYLSLDGFKKVNEVAGYVAGDAILKEVGQRISSNLREIDYVSRFADNEFVIILTDTGGAQSLTKVAEKLVSLLNQHFAFDDHQYYLNATIGIAVYPTDAITVDSLLQYADATMNRAKSHGHEKFAFNEAQMNSFAIHRLAMERDLRLALEKQELYLLYQPQMDLRNGKVVGVEALVRWRHPTNGVIPPIEFISIAEESNLIMQLGEQVRRMACQQYRTWQDARIAPKRMAINVSSKELMRDNFATDFLNLLNEYGVLPNSIELEITESLLLNITGPLSESLKILRQQGVLIDIDDFGTGYSSLSYLTTLPFDVLKIDRAFVTEVVKASDKSEVVSMIITLAHHLRKTVCAEGVETEAQLQFLKDLGCEKAQGYLISDPLSAGDFESFLKTQSH